VLVFVIVLVLIVVLRLFSLNTTKDRER
jgi:hypothetical protein